MNNFDRLARSPPGFLFDLTRAVAIFMNGIGTEL